MPTAVSTTTERLAPFRGLCLYGTSAKPGTLAAYRAVEDNVIGGRLNVRRAFSGLPEPGDPCTIWSTKEFSEASALDRQAAFAAYGEPCFDIFHHEPLPGNPPDPMDYGPDRYDEFEPNARTVLEGHAGNVVRCLCFQRADIVDGTLTDMVPSKPDFVDCVFFDAYRDKPDGRSAKELITPCIELAAEWGCLWGLAEWGVVGTGDARRRWSNDLVELCCDDATCVALVNYQSTIGKRAPTNFDGTVGWFIEKSLDRHTPEMATFYRDLAWVTRDQAAKNGSPASL